MTQAVISKLLVHLPAQGAFLIVSDAPAGTADWVDVFPGVRAINIAKRIVSETLVYNRWQWNGHTLTLSSDAMGLKPLYRAMDEQGGHWFASSIAQLLQVNPDWAQPIDRIGLHSLFIGRACWGTRTLHAKISRVATGTQLTWNAQSGITENRARRWRLLDPDPGLSEAAAMTPLRDILGSSDARWRGNDVYAAQALSGGYDSRLLAVLQPSAPPSFTYGRANLRENQQATTVAQLLGLAQTFIALPRDLVFDELPHATQLFESTQDPALLQAAPLAQVDLPPGSIWLHGFAGDVIAGSFTTRIKPGDLDTHDTLAAAIVRYYSFQGVDAQALFGFAFDETALIADIRADLDTRVSPLAAYHLWCWESHLRRFTTGLLSVMGERFDLRLPYYDKAYVDAWSRVPLQGLQNRQWFKRWFGQNWPALAAIPHPDDAPTPLWRRALNKFLDYRKIEELLRAVGASDYIYDIPNLTSTAHRAKAASMIAERAAALADMQLALAPHYTAALDDPRFRYGQSRRLLLGLAAYAAHLQALAVHGEQP